MADIIQWRRDTAANWLSVDPVLASGEAGFETDTSKMKHGDGVTIYSLLPYTGTTAGAVPEAPLDTIPYAREDGAWVSSTKTTGANKPLALESITQAAYDLLAPPDANTIYFIEA